MDDATVPKTNAEWKARLDPQVFHVTREKGTEVPFTGKYVNETAAGVYKCSNCGQELFSSTAKFDSESGWPSFDEPVNLAHVRLVLDESLGMSRTEVVCKNCGAHLGHVFDDGPTKTGQRYCINSCALNLEKSP